MTRSADPAARPYRMHNQVQTYAWGTRDENAYIPRLLQIRPKPGTPYAELWLGTHPKAPSRVEPLDGTVVGLDKWIAAHPIATLGQSVYDRFGGLPFLLKVLSAGEALSIQAHPNKAQAEVLHASDPAHYPDDNHKPEIAIALDSLTALMGLKPFAGLAATLGRYPEIAAVIGAPVTTKVAAAAASAGADEAVLARELFTTLILRARAEPNSLRQAVDTLAGRLSGQGRGLDEAEQRFLDLGNQYGSDDVGLFALFLFNIAHLASGEGLFTQAGVPHAYLKGNIIECMANSDNVVRVGLTPKFRDAETLIQIVDATPRTPRTLSGNPQVGEGGVTSCVYETPAAEFEIRRWTMPPETRQEVAKGDVPAVLLVIQGRVEITWEGGREILSMGESVFLPACLTQYGIRAIDGADLFQAAVPDS